MADLSTYKVDLETSRPNPNNPLEVRKGDAPRTAFAKYNAVIDLLGGVVDGSTAISATPPDATAPYMTWIDTSESPARIKRRNADDTAWVTLGKALQTAGDGTGGGVTGEFGEITPYQPPSEEQVLAEQTRKMRGERDRRLAQLDTVVSNPLRWAGYTADQQAALAAYRQALLDVPQQEGFPVEIDWPVMPET